MELLDCTLRDGGYYNAWDFPDELVDSYLSAMQGAGVDLVELGFRSLKNDGFKGPYAFTTDDFLETLTMPPDLTVGVMVNASELVGELPQEQVLEKLFPRLAVDSPVDLVRIACHTHEFSQALPASHWLTARGYRVGFNLMQIADLSAEQLVALAREASHYPLSVLYFADSMGSMDPERTTQIIDWIRQGWSGPLGIHTHDNMGMAMQNTLKAIDNGATWVDSTVTGMGRGPGNASTEVLAVEIAHRRGVKPNLIPLMTAIRQHFKPLQQQYGWGTNVYYHLTGRYGIHPTYVQEMLGDARYSEEDIFAVISQLREEGGKKFNLSTLDAARHFYQGAPQGHWQPRDWLQGREVLLLGTGPGVEAHRGALEAYIRRHKPLVMALNTQAGIQADHIDVRVACHPIRLLADREAHARLPQALITPLSMLPEDVRAAFAGKEVLDFGLGVQENTFTFADTHCTLPASLVVAYALAIATSGQASRVLMAGFDGYSADDPRSREMQTLLALYHTHERALETIAVTPTRFSLVEKSIYAL